MNRFRAFVSSALLALLLGSCGTSGGGCRGWFPGDRFLGNPSPNFTLPNLDGQLTELAKVAQEKPTLIVFWATWCPTCNEEIPILNKWVDLYPQVQILAVDVQESAERVRAFAKKKKIRYTVLLDEEGEVSERYGLVGIPASVLLAKGGKIIYYGFSLPYNVEKLIQQ